ncbi:MAG: cytochrome c [Acidobacteria bacterium]|nr:cytochrome c [Acidobacteriota bacterium]MBS1867551.1 cytochrome c [Acidobacteriota bacterium]
MRRALACLGTIMLAGISSCLAQQDPAQEKPKETPPAAAEPAAKPAANEKKNPVTPTPEALAASKKFFGYDCAMCHGATGDGKGDMVESMKLAMKDWREPATLDKMTDAQIYELIVKGKGQMTGEGDRMTPDQVWKMVNYVRSLAKKSGSTTSAEAPKQ